MIVFGAQQVIAGGMGRGTKATIKVAVWSLMRIRQVTVNVAMEQYQCRNIVARKGVTAHAMKLVTLRLRAVSCPLD